MTITAICLRKQVLYENFYRSAVIRWWIFHSFLK